MFDFEILNLNFVWNLVLGAWNFLVFGAWNFLVFGAWNLEL